MKPSEFTIPARYYSRGSVDWDGGVPAKGFRGELTKHITLSAKNTAITCVHIGNEEYPGGGYYCGDEPGVEAYYHLAMNRMHAVIENNIAPLLNAARAAGARILHLAPCREAYAEENYPQYREIKSRVKIPPLEWDPSKLPNVEWLQTVRRAHKEKRDKILGPNFRLVLKEGEQPDIAPLVKPQPEDWVVASGWDKMASTLFNENGIWNLFFVGFEAASCVPSALRRMRSLGYRCFIVEDCSKALETRETREKEEIQNTFFKAMQLGGYAYIVNGRDVTRAFKESSKGST